MTRAQLKALYRQVIKVVAGGPTDKTRGGTTITMLDELTDSVVVPADLPALLVTNKLRGTDKIVQNMVARAALETAGVLTVGTSCFVQNSADVADFLAGAVEPPKFYVVSQNAALVAPTGFLAYIDGSDTPTTVRAEWVEAGTFDAQVAAYPFLDRTQAVALGDEFKYRGGDGKLRLFRAKTAQAEPIPPALLPAPPDGGSDASYEEISPAAGTGYTDLQAVTAAFGDRFVTTTRANYLYLVDEEIAPKPGTVYNISDAPGGAAQGMLTTSNPTVMEAAVRAGFAGLWRYDITANTFVEASGGVADGSITDAKLAAEVKVGSLAALLTTVKTSVVDAINELRGVATTNTTNITTNTSAIGTLANLTTTVKTSLVAAINEVVAAITTNTNNIGTLASLNTTAKGNLVAAINEVRNTMVTFATVQTASFTITSAMAGQRIEVNSASAVTVTVPHTLAAGLHFTFSQRGTGQLVFAGSGGMTIDHPDNHTKSRRLKSPVAILIVSATVAELTGDTAA